jgi:putative inorganic carbon (hco3(-)) transporter
LSGETIAYSISMQRSVSRRAPQAGAYISLLLFMVVYFTRPEDWIPGVAYVHLAKITAIVASVALVFSVLHGHKKLPREVFYLSLLVGQLFLAAMLSPVWKGGAVQLALSFAKILIIVVIMAVVVTTLARLQQLIFVHAGSVAVMASVAVLKWRSVGGRLEGTLGGNFGDPNDLALAIIVSLPMCLALLFLTRSWLRKTACTLAVVVMLIAVFLTGSRGGFLALIVTAAVFLWEFAVRGGRRYLLALAVVTGAALWLASSGLIVGRLKGTFSPNEDAGEAYASSQARKELFWRSVEVTREHPLFGVGPGNFMQVSGDWHVAHNSYTQMSAEGGIPALILYGLILWSGFKNIRDTKRFASRNRETSLLAKALHASLLGYITGSCFLTLDYAFFPYFFVAYTTALFLIAKQSATASRSRREAKSSAPFSYATTMNR